jgi:NAD(P)-dependent dehydrogenase (short-subunit alcohol dehydrogenase family)
MEYPLKDRVAIVTGAGQGIGAAIARRLAAAGARVAVNDINPTKAEQVAQSIKDNGGEAVAISADIANKFQCVHLIENTRAEWDRLDILVNNAAVEPTGSILKFDEWDWQRCIDVNLKAVFFMSQLCGRVMKDAGGGVIVNIGSTAGVEKPLANRAAYCASKAGMVGFARECAREFAGYGIRVNTVLPGIIDTPVTQRMGAADPDKRAKWEQMIPLGRLGQGDEIAQTVLFLASDASSYLTGSTVTVDGGMVMR